MYGLPCEKIPAPSIAQFSWKTQPRIVGELSLASTPPPRWVLPLINVNPSSRALRPSPPRMFTTASSPRPSTIVSVAPNRLRRVSVLPRKSRFSR